MPVKIIRQDITKLKVDVIVNATNPSFDATGGLDRYIHQLAGKELDEECRKVGKLKVGQACLTNGYKLCKYIIHTAGPVWNMQKRNNAALLEFCYLSSLRLADSYKLKSIAFPLISSGNNQFPKELALKVAMHSIVSFLTDHEMMVYLVIFDRKSYKISSELFDSIEAYIDDCYEDEHMVMCNSILPSKLSLLDALNQMDESFSTMLLRKIDESGMSDVECYKKANVDRKLFSKIRSNPNYKPSKQTVIAFALALELPLDEMDDMLNKAGFSLSHSNKFDIIVEYFVSQGNYNVFEINEALFAFDQSLIGV